jgi:hypothetical protein
MVQAGRHPWDDFAFGSRLGWPCPTGSRVSPPLFCWIPSYLLFFTRSDHCQKEKGKAAPI